MSGTVSRARVYLDASVIVRLSLSNPLGRRLLQLKLIDTGLDIVCSIYAIQEALGVISESDCPPKVSLAVIVFLGYMILTDLIHIRLEQSSHEAISRCSGLCRDESDLPVLADAWVEGCDVVVTGDRDFLDDQERIKQHTGVNCIGLEYFLSQYESQPEVAAALQSSKGQDARPER